MHSKSYNKSTVLIIGPYPPPSGGVATFIKSLMNQEILHRNYNIKLFRTGKKNETISFPNQVLKDIFRIVNFLFTLKFKNINIFHIHTSSYWSFIRNIPYILISNHLSKGKIIIHIHGGGFHIFFKKASKPIKKIIKNILNSSNYIIVTSPSWVKIIGEICNDFNHIFSIPNGFDEKTFYPIQQEKARERINLPKEKKILLNIGSLEDYKGQRYLIESMNEIVKEKNDARTYIIGSGSQEVYLKTLIKEYNLEEYVFLVDAGKPPNEIAQWINACDIFVLPSLTEGNPTVMFECLACGKPFIGTKVGGVPDIIISDEYGFLSKAKDTKDLTEKISMALNKEWNTEKIIKYSENFTWSKIVKNIIDIYQK